MGTHRSAICLFCTRPQSRTISICTTALCSGFRTISLHFMSRFSQKRRSTFRRVLWTRNSNRNGMFTIRMHTNSTMRYVPVDSTLTHLNDEHIYFAGWLQCYSQLHVGRRQWQRSGHKDSDWVRDTKIKLWLSNADGVRTTYDISTRKFRRTNWFSRKFLEYSKSFHITNLHISHGIHGNISFD